MKQTILIGLGAGAAAALLFASLASGSIIAPFLFYLAPLPIMIVGLGWSPWVALMAGVSAAAALGVSLDAHMFVAFLLGIGLPAWWLSYLSLLARPAATEPGGLAWYPTGRLVLWAAIVSAGVLIAAIVSIAGDKAALQNLLRAAFEQAMGLSTTQAAGGLEPLNRPDAERVIDLLVVALPPGAAVVAIVIYLINLWLAGRVVRMSGLLRRPWPDLSALTLPPQGWALVAAAIAGSVLPDLPGVLSSILAASLLTAYALVGFSVMHAITRGMSHRGLVLGGLYGATLLFGWPVLAASALGLIETAFNLRRRALARRTPPAPHPNRSTSND